MKEKKTEDLTPEQLIVNLVHIAEGLELFNIVRNSTLDEKKKKEDAEFYANAGLINVAVGITAALQESSDNRIKLIKKYSIKSKKVLLQKPTLTERQVTNLKRAETVLEVISIFQNPKNRFHF